MEALSDRQKGRYMKTAMNIIGFNVNEKGAAILVQVYEYLLAYKGSLKLAQVISIQEGME
ncbi:MAG: hypothetical protein GX163_03270, partial [Bacteroidetes bacterium]|nr:hypothetical protein [Bacteroidota bacterium]